MAISVRRLSSSSIKLLLDSPKKYKYVTEYGSTRTALKQVGYFIHILEPDVFEKQTYVDVI